MNTQRVGYAISVGLIATLLLLPCCPGASWFGNQDRDTRTGKTVFVLPIKGPIDKALLFVFRRAFQLVDKLNPDAVIIELDTPGGSLRETEEIVDWLRSVDVPTYAFVNPHALSAGAIISLGTDSIFMAPGGRIGSAMPIMMTPGGGAQEMPEGINEKILSDTRALVRGLAQENDHNEDVAMAMVDRSLEVKIGDRVISESGKLLNLTAREAIEIIPPNTEPLLATAIVENLEALLAHADLEGAQVRRFEEQSAERLARYITMIGPILLALGALGVYIEIKTPGFGVPGIAGVSLLIIYFFGHYVAGLAGIEDIALVVIGAVLLTIEIFVIPGFGVAGIAGMICMGAGLLMGLIPHLPSVKPLPNVTGSAVEDLVTVALLKLLATVVIGGVGIALLSRLLPRTRFYHSLVLETELSKDDGYVSGESSTYGSYVGTEGRALTALRPSGTAEFGDKRLDVVTSGDLIPRGATVRIIDVEGARIVVEAVPPDSPEASATDTQTPAAV